jgi:hypothetical protein
VNREQLEHALRAAADITGDYRILVIGSQSILGSFDESQLPPEATVSREIDIGFFDDPRGKKADDVEGAIGEDSDFDRTFEFFVDGVDLDTATLPNGWWNRLVEVQGPGTNRAVGQCLEPHDCVASKLAAGREKDYVFAAALLDAGLVHADVLIERIPTMDPRKAPPSVAATNAGLAVPLDPLNAHLTEEGVPRRPFESQRPSQGPDEAPAPNLRLRWRSGRGSQASVGPAQPGRRTRPGPR